MCMNQYLASLPETYLVIAISVLLVFGALGLAAKNSRVEPSSALSSNQQNSASQVFAYLVDGNANLSRMCWLGVFVCGITAWLSMASLNVEYTGRFIVDEYSMTIKTVILSASAIILLLSTPSVLAANRAAAQRSVSRLAADSTQTGAAWPEVRATTASEKVYAYEMVVLILLAVTGLLLLISSYDLLALYLSIELQSLSLYVLATLKRSSEYSTEAGLKYFILGAISSGLLLFGSSLIYGLTGSIKFSDIASGIAASASTIQSSAANNENFLLIIGVVFVLSGLLFKLSIAPFHQWTPDVYEGSPTNVTAFFAIVPKLALLGVSLRMVLIVFNEPFTLDGANSVSEISASVLVCCSILSMLVGAFGGLYQTKLKRLIAYSAIGHMGYLTIGLVTGSIEGVTAVFVYLFIYMITSIGFFTLLLAVESASAQSLSRDRRIRLTYITDLALLSKAHPLLALSAAIILFSMAGIPPLAGFFSKLYLFLAAISSSLYILATIAVLTSVVGCFYYVRLIKYIYFSSPNTVEPLTTSGVAFSRLHSRPHQITLSLTHSLILALVVFFLVLFILYPGPILMAALYLAVHLLVA